jgi:hypothetical protein
MGEDEDQNLTIELLYTLVSCKCNSITIIEIGMVVMFTCNLICSKMRPRRDSQIFGCVPAARRHWMEHDS